MTRAGATQLEPGEPFRRRTDDRQTLRPSGVGRRGVRLSVPVEQLSLCFVCYIYQDIANHGPTTARSTPLGEYVLEMDGKLAKYTQNRRAHLRRSGVVGVCMHGSEQIAIL